MNKKLIPTYLCDSVFKINYEYLKSKNILNIFLSLKRLDIINQILIFSIISLKKQKLLLQKES